MENLLEGFEVTLESNFFRLLRVLFLKILIVLCPLGHHSHPVEILVIARKCEMTGVSTESLRHVSVTAIEGI